MSVFLAYLRPLEQREQTSSLLRQNQTRVGLVVQAGPRRLAFKVANVVTCSHVHKDTCSAPARKPALSGVHAQQQCYSTRGGRRWGNGWVQASKVGLPFVLSRGADGCSSGGKRICQLSVGNGNGFVCTFLSTVLNITRHALKLLPGDSYVVLFGL